MSKNGLGTDELKSWFLGAKGENAHILSDLAAVAIERAGLWRSGQPVPAPPPGDYKHGALHERVVQLLDYLHDRTVPAYSSRYQAHMGWDLLTPGILGHLIGLLFPANNVAYEGSPGTTALEMLVARDLCRMLGFEAQPAIEGRPAIEPWGHLVGGGTIGNIEALWAARNLKFLPLALKSVLTTNKAYLELGKAFKVDDKWLLRDLDTWTLLNLPIDISLALPAQFAAQLAPGQPQPVQDALRREFDDALNAASVNQRGMHAFLTDAKPPKILLSHDNHYSLDKAAALLGLGQDSLGFVRVDAYGRMNLNELEVMLRSCVEDKVPVLAIVANFGSTELGAVDSLRGILDLKSAFNRRGLDFMVHVDAAFGGYHASLLHEKLEFDWKLGKSSAALDVSPVVATDRVPEIGLSDYVQAQFAELKHADSIAVDPHKLGFLPYPGGAICYRNSALRDLTKFSAPYLGAIVPQGIAQVGDLTDQFLGVFGVEGSRPGGASAAAFLSHSLLRPDKHGYGRLGGKELFAAKRVLAALCSLNRASDFLRVAVAGKYTQEEEAALAALAEKPDEDIDAADKALLARCGPDLNLLCYAFNFKRGKEWNQDLLWINVFNLLMYGQLDLSLSSQPERPLIVSKTIFSGREGTQFIKGILQRLKVASPENLQHADLVAMRSAEWNPWLTEEDPGLASFKGALTSAAQVAYDTLVPRLPELSEAARGLEESLGGFATALGIVGLLRAPPEALGDILAASKDNPIVTALNQVIQAMAVTGLPASALQHFSKRT